MEKTIVQTGKEDFVDADFLLIKRMRQGEEEAFDTFVRKYYGDIFRYCTYHCGDTEDAEDLTQETFVHFFAKFSDYRHRGKVKNYLYTIAGNLCRNYYRDRKKDLIQNREPVLNGEEGHEDAVTDRLFFEWAISRLPEELRDLIYLYYFQEMKLKEAAKILQIGLPLAKYRLREARKRLKKMLEEENFENEKGGIL